MAVQSMQSIEDDLSVTGDYIPGVRGYAVLVVGQDGGKDGDGDQSVAIWRLSATGHSVGAWTLRLRDIETDPQPLQNVISLLRGRCLVDWDADRPDAALRGIERWLAPDLVSTLRSNLLLIPDLLQEVREHRRTCAEAVDRHRPATRSSILPLAWSMDLPDDPAQARTMLTPAPTAASPVVAEALTLAGAVRRAVELWQDTEQVRYRRVYLRSLGEVQPLPPRWLAALRRAAAGPAEAEAA